MTISSEVYKRIQFVGDGALVSLADFSDLENPQAVCLTLSRLCKQRKIRRLYKGTYYTPSNSRFGELLPDESQIIKMLLKDGAYVAGLSVYNRFGLTTQVPNEVIIKSKKCSGRTKIGNLKIRYVRETKKFPGVPPVVLQILDCFDNIKSIPGADLGLSFLRMAEIVAGVSGQDREWLAKAALECKPGVRAMVGVALELIDEKLASKLKASLNPISSYKIGLTKVDVPGIPNSIFKEWRIQ